MAVSRRRLVASRGEIADSVEGIQRLLEQRRAQLAGREAQLQATWSPPSGPVPTRAWPDSRRPTPPTSSAASGWSPSWSPAWPSAGCSPSSVRRAAASRRWCGPGCCRPWPPGCCPGAERWRSTILCPGPHPAGELARRLHDADEPAGEPRVVFVDQFEETFTLGADRRRAGRVRRPPARPWSTSPDTSVVLAIRADHLGRCAAYPELADRLTGNDVLVGPMRDTELRRAVELPAQRAGLEVEPGLVEVIVADVAGRAGALPLLSTALAETWERRRGRDADPRRLPRRRRRQRGAGPDGRGRLLRIAGRRPGRGSPGAAAAVRCRRRTAT